MNHFHKHWLFYPSISFIIQLLIYIIFFSAGGYIQYNALSEEKILLKNQIHLLEKEKRKSLETLKVMQDHGIYENFKQYMIHHHTNDFNGENETKEKIIKFKDMTVSDKILKKTKDHLWEWQKLYIIISSILQLSLIYFFYLRHKKDKTNKKNPPYALS